MKIWCKKYQNKASCSLYVIPLTKLLYKIVCTFYNHHWEMKSQKYPTCCLMISTTGLWAITQIFFCVLSVAQHSCHTRQAFKGFDRQTKQKKKTTWMWCLCPVKKVKKKQDGEYNIIHHPLFVLQFICPMWSLDGYISAWKSDKIPSLLFWLGKDMTRVAVICCHTEFS